MKLINKTEAGGAQALPSGERRTTMMYKGFTIEKVTRVDWMVKDSAGNLVRTEDDRPTTRTLREAKALAELCEKKYK